MIGTAIACEGNVICGDSRTKISENKDEGECVWCIRISLYIIHTCDDYQICISLMTDACLQQMYQFNQVITASKLARFS